MLRTCCYGVVVGMTSASTIGVPDDSDWPFQGPARGDLKCATCLARAAFKETAQSNRDLQKLITEWLGYTSSSAEQ